MARCFLVCTALLISLSGCTYQYTKNELAQLGIFGSLSQIDRHQQWVISGRSSIYVAYPISPFSSKVDRSVLDGLTKSLVSDFALTQKGLKPTGVAEAMMLARQAGCGFMIYPKLLNYEDNASSFQEMDEDMVELSEMGRDHLTVQLMLFDSNTGSLLDAITIKAKSNLLAYHRAGPSELIEGAFTQFSQQLVAREH